MQVGSLMVQLHVLQNRNSELASLLDAANGLSPSGDAAAAGTGDGDHDHNDDDADVAAEEETDGDEGAATVDGATARLQAREP